MRILTVDDHQLFRDGMKSLLAQWRSDATVIDVGRLADALDALARNPRFDLILLDLTLPDSLDPEATVRSMREAAGEVPIVAISMEERVAVLARAIGAGARGFIRKSDSAAVMLATLDMVLAGGSCIPSELLTQAEPAARLPALSTRQREVLRLIARGLSNKEISRELGIAEATVKVHVHHVLRLIDAPSRAKAAIWASRMALVEAEPPVAGAVDRTF